MDERQRGARYIVVGGINTLFGVIVFAAMDIVLAPHIGHYFVLALHRRSGSSLPCHPTPLGVAFG